MALEELDRDGIPQQDGELDAADLLLDSVAGDEAQHLSGDAEVPVLLAHVDVFQVQAALGDEGGVGLEHHGEAHRLAGEEGQGDVDDAIGPRQLGAQRVGRRLMRQSFVGGEGRDHLVEHLGVGRGGEAQFESGDVLAGHGRLGRGLTAPRGRVNVAPAAKPSVSATADAYPPSSAAASTASICSGLEEFPRVIEVDLFPHEHREQVAIHLPAAHHAGEDAERLAERQSASCTGDPAR